MRPILLALAIAVQAGLIGFVPSSPVRAQSVEDQAGDLLYKAGKRAFERGRYAQAAEKFRKALDVAFGGEISQAPVPLLNMLGRSLAKLDRCAEAVPVLVAAETPNAPPEAVKARTRAEVTCRRTLAQEALDAKRCIDAMPHLKRLERRLSGRDEAWRTGAVDHCLAKLTDFETSTPDRKAAYQLFQAARAARDRGDLARAEELYQKALSVVDEPIIRTELAAVLFDREACAEAREVLAPVPSAQVSSALQTAKQRCGGGEVFSGASPGSGSSHSLEDDGEGMSTMGVLGLVSIGVSALGIASGAVLISFGEDALRRQAKWEDAASDAASQGTGNEAAYLDRARDANASAEANRYSGIAVLTLGVAALGTGIVLLVLDGGDDEASEEAGVRVMPLIGPTSAGLSVRF